MKKIYFFKQEQGSALIVAVFALLVLSLAGFMAMKTAIIETEISGNLKNYKNNFYKTEATVQIMALGLQNTPDSTISGSQKLIVANNILLSPPPPSPYSDIPLQSLGSFLDPNDQDLVNLRPLVLQNELQPELVLKARQKILGEIAKNASDPNPQDPESIFKNGPYPNSSILVVDSGPAPGSSMSLGYSHTASLKHRFFIYSNVRENTALGRGVVVEIGYLKRIRN